MLNEKSALEKEQVRLQRDLEVASRAGQDTKERLENLAQLFDAMGSLQGQELIDLKLRLRQEIGRLIRRIDVYPEGEVRVDPEGDKAFLVDLEEFLKGVEPGSLPEYEEFLRVGKETVVNPRDHLALTVWFAGGSIQRLYPRRTLTRRSELDVEAGVYRHWYEIDGKEVCWDFTLPKRGVK